MLDRLEQRERDPEHRDGLFELEHLATRMRRNTENLLVLAGEASRGSCRTPRPASGRRGGGGDRAARDGRVGPLPDVEVRGAVVADLGHLLAELLENATTSRRWTPRCTLDAGSARTKP